MRNASSKKGLRKKAVFSLLSVGSLIMVVGLLLTTIKGRAELRRAIGSSFEGLARETAHNAELILAKELLLLDFLSHSGEIRGALETSHELYQILSEEEERRELDERSRRYQSKEGKEELQKNRASQFLEQVLTNEGLIQLYKALFITDKKGALIASINAYPEYLHAHETWWREVYNNQKGTTLIGDVYRDEKAGGVFALPVAIPVFESDRSEVIGVIKAVFDLKAMFEPVIHEIRFGRKCDSPEMVAGQDCTGHAMLIDSEGIVLICPILPTGSHVTDPLLLAPVTSLQPGWVVAENDAHGGKDSIVGFAPVKKISSLINAGRGKRWHSFIRQDPRELYAPIRSLTTSVISSGILLIGILVIVGGTIAKRLVRPLEILQQGAEMIGKGNLDHRLAITTGDEVEELADKFNHMALALKTAYDELEKKVADRTRELSLLYSVTATLSQSIKLEDILKISVAKAMEVSGAHASGIYLFDQSEQLVLNAHKGYTDVMGRELSSIPVADGFTERVLRGEEVIFPQEISGDSLWREKNTRDGLCAFICLPLKQKEKVLGALVLFDRHLRSLTSQEVDFLTNIARQIGNSIENALLFEKTKRLERIKTDFVSKVSHEFRTPLTSIKGFAEILLSYRDVDPETQKEFLSIINEEAERLTRLINDVLDLSKIEAGRIEWDVKPLVLRDIILITTKSMQNMAFNKGLSLSIDAPSDLPRVMADRDKLIQVIDNLLSNAIKFTDQGGIIVGASLDRVNREMVRTFVRDTGIGIPPEERQGIFEKFHQVRDPERGGPSGTGLGLAICKEIITFLGGEIWCESERGKGSTFFFTLPVAQEVSLTMNEVKNRT